MRKRYKKPSIKVSYLMIDRCQMVDISNSDTDREGSMWTNEYHDFGDEEDTDWKRK